MAGFITRHANLLQTRADRIKELQADNAKIQKDFDRLLVRDTANLKRLIDAQAQLEAMSNALEINQTLSDKRIKALQEAVRGCQRYTIAAHLTSNGVTGDSYPAIVITTDNPNGKWVEVKELRAAIGEVDYE
jgi:hypothetical protein